MVLMGRRAAAVVLDGGDQAPGVGDALLGGAGQLDAHQVFTAHAVVVDAVVGGGAYFVLQAAYADGGYGLSIKSGSGAWWMRATSYQF